MAQKTILLARQPICNVDKEIVAYELLFRYEDGSAPSNLDGDQATSQVLLNAFCEGGVTSVTGGKPAFVNFTENLLEQLPPFDPERLYIELLEDIKITDDLVEKIKILKENHFKIAIDDFVWDDSYRPVLEYTDIVKLEVPAMNRQQLQTTVRNLKLYDVSLLAEKVETHEEFEQCKELGCTLFQGYFLFKPQIVEGKKLSSAKLAVLKLIADLQDPEASVAEITTAINRDPVLSFKLLALVNSAAFRRPCEVNNISTAVSLLGVNRLRSWASMLAMGSLDDKPESLQLIALQRAEFCDLIAEVIAPAKRDQFYMIGLLSSLDLFFDIELSTLVKELPLDADSKLALIEYAGDAGLALKTAKFYESFRLSDVNWSTFHELGMRQQDLHTMYLKSNVQANALLSQTNE